MLRLDLWRKPHTQNPGAYATAAACRRKKSLPYPSLLNEVCSKVNVLNKGNTHRILAGVAQYTVPKFKLSKTDPSVGNLSSGALRILFAG